MSEKIAVLGAGSWGTALAATLAKNGHVVSLWGTNLAVIESINHKQCNDKYLPDTVLPSRVAATLNLAEAVRDCDAVLFAVPTNAVRTVAKQLASVLEHSPYLIHAGKGLEQGTHLRISQVIAQEIDSNSYKDIVVLSGPSHAEEVAHEDLTLITAACESETAAKYVQNIFMNAYFRVYTNTDVIGVELGAALKNVIALGAGIVHGLGYGDNAKAALVTRGLAEITRFGLTYGAKAPTFSGLSGVGDLIVTCTSVHSRNWQFGHLLGSGKTYNEAMATIHMAVEGVWTVKAVKELADENGIDLPITQAIYDVIYNNKPCKEAILGLMARVGKSE